VKRLIDDIADALARATTITGACQAALDALHEHSGAVSAVLLRVRDQLRCAAAAGTWQVYLSMSVESGIVGRVCRTGETAVVTDVTRDADFIALGPPVAVEICVPVPGPDGTPVGVLDVEFAYAVETESWRTAIEDAAVLVGRRVEELGGVVIESRNEMLARHGLTLSTAETEPELALASLTAAREISGLDTPVLVLAMPNGEYEVIVDETHPTTLARGIAKLPIESLIDYVKRAHRLGASYSVGDPAEHNPSGFEALTDIGVRSLITVPVGAHSPLGGVLLVVDERVSHPDQETIALMTLLAAQAWSSRERILMLAHLHERALSDPLTGLRHQGSFGERLATATPGQTAVFAIDVDGFKAINDTYGHQAGDRALVALAQALSTALRTQDELYRIGGDEFAAIVEVRRGSEALAVADRLIHAARVVGHPISVGVAIRRSGELSEETLRRADTALYLAKREGRDAARLAP
jgi:diguanylate cyclase (GGDEF)-like protein